MNFGATCSCVMKIVEPLAHATVEDLKAVVSKVKALEDEGRILPWDDEHVPDEIVHDKPSPGCLFFTSVFITILAYFTENFMYFLFFVGNEINVTLSSLSLLRMNAIPHSSKNMPLLSCSIRFFC